MVGIIFLEADARDWRPLGLPTDHLAGFLAAQFCWGHKGAACSTHPSFWEMPCLIQLETRLGILEYDCPFSQWYSILGPFLGRPLTFEGRYLPRAIVRAGKLPFPEYYIRVGSQILIRLKFIQGPKAPVWCLSTPLSCTVCSFHIQLLAGPWTYSHVFRMYWPQCLECPLPLIDLLSVHQGSI